MLIGYFFVFLQEEHIKLRKKGISFSKMIGLSRKATIVLDAMPCFHKAG